MTLTTQELSDINGGVLKTASAIIICGVIIFAMGVASGWKRPLSCKSGK